MIIVSKTSSWKQYPLDRMDPCPALTCGHKLMQHFQALWPEFRVQQAHAGDIAARPVEAGDEAHLDRIVAAEKDDWNR